MNMKKCKYCQSEIPEKASVCPVCKRRLNTWKFVLAGILAFVGFCVILGVGSEFVNTTIDLNEGHTSVTTKKEAKNSPKITMEEFTSIKLGMTYDEVVALIGSKGELMGESGFGDYVMTIYSWEGEGIAAAATITFENGKVSAKAQIGLEE